MLYVVTGGSGSGKSEYAESLAVELYNRNKKNKACGSLYYAAAMYPHEDEETVIRIERHRALRKGKGFETIECYTDIGKLTALGKGNTILVECMSNLLANEMYMDKEYIVSDEADAERYIVNPLKQLGEMENNVIVVTNEVFSDGKEKDYDTETRCYIKLLGYINVRMAKLADGITEVVCGIPVRYK